MSKKVPQPKAKTSGNARNSSKRELRKSYVLNSYPKNWYYACWILYLCYCYAAFVPTGPVWGIHFIGYLPVAARLALLIAGGLLLLPNIQRSLYLAAANKFGSPTEEQKIRLLRPAIVAGICFVAFHTFTMRTDIYGDTINMLKWYGDNTTFDWHWITDVLSPHVVDNKEALTVALHRIVAYVFSIPIESSYRIMSELCGTLFIFVWLLFVQKISSGPLLIVLALLGMFAGAVQVFFGHVENYSFGILTSTIFLIALYYYLEEKIGTLAFVLLYLLAFKAHIIAILFLPAFLVALAYHYRNNIPKLESFFTWRGMLLAVILPALVVGLALYIFLFHSWNEPYAIRTGRQFQQTFLPVISLPAPLDHYSLWSPYHIADFFNLLLLTCAPIIVLLANVMIFNRKDISWSQPRVIVFGLAALFPFLFFMAMNPTLSPVRDWDVYTLLFPPLLFFASVLLIQSGVRSYVPAWLAQSVVFGVLFTTVLVAVNASPDELQIRLEDAGAYTYRSYYASSAYIEARSFVLDDTSGAGPTHFLKIVEELAKSSTPGKDDELGDMMSRLASVFAHAGDANSAIKWAAAAQKADTSNDTHVDNLAVYYINANRLPEASSILEEFLRNRVSGFAQKDTELAKIMSHLAAGYSRTGDDRSTIAWAEHARESDPRNLKYVYHLADYYLQDNKPLQSLEALRSIPADSVSAKTLMFTAIAAKQAFGPDSALPYLYKAKAMAPNNRDVDSLIRDMESKAHRKE